MEIRPKLCKPDRRVVRPYCSWMILHIKGNEGLRPHRLDDGGRQGIGCRDPGTVHRVVLLVV